MLIIIKIMDQLKELTDFANFVDYLKAIMKKMVATYFIDLFASKIME